MRQFDLLVRMRADEMLMAGRVNGRVKKAVKAKADAIAEAAEEAWGKMKEPPATVDEACKLDQEVEVRCAVLRRQSEAVDVEVVRRLE